MNTPGAALISMMPKPPAFQERPRSTAITSMPMQVRRKWRATSWARSALSTWTVGVTSMLTPPAERFATLRSQTSRPRAGMLWRVSALLLDAGDHRLVA